MHETNNALFDEKKANIKTSVYLLKKQKIMIK